jgi:quinol-cytochrome oxidoreductase complex cytochrome b subunit
MLAYSQEVRRGGGGLMQTLERLVATIVSAWLAMLALTVVFHIGGLWYQRSTNSGSSSSLSSGIPGISTPAAVSSATSASSYAPKEYIKVGIILIL